MTLAFPKPEPPVRVRRPLAKGRRPIARKVGIRRGCVLRKAGKPARKTRVRAQGKSELASMVRAADALFSKLIRARDPMCAVCKTEPSTDCAHHMPRTFAAVRWDMDNASGLCRRSHRFMTANPYLWQLWWTKKLGLERATELESTARAGASQRIAVEEALLWMRRRGR